MRLVRIDDPKALGMLLIEPGTVLPIDDTDRIVHEDYPRFRVWSFGKGIAEIVREWEEP